MGGPRFTVRALFLSDVHLGTRACQAERLLEFLRDYEFQTLYLVGDIIDFWALRRSVYWPAEHNTVVQKVLRSARHGAQVVYIPGNHDEALRDYLEHAFGAIVMVREHVHVTADGRRFLLTHGDEYDQITTYARWLSVLGDVSYTWLLQVNRMLSWWRRKLGIAGHWSLADYAKRNVQKAASFISGFETAIAHHVRGRGFDGVICGHIHTPVIRQIEDITYMNCGDWVDSCSAIVEHLDGRMELVRQGDSLPLHVAAPGAASLALASASVSALQRHADRPREAANT